MATKYKTNKRKLSSLVKQQIPEFVLTDHPKFAEFLSSYFLFMESAELNLDTITDIDQILLETEGTTDSYVLLDQTNKNGLDAGNKLVDEQNTFGGSFQKTKQSQALHLAPLQQFLQKIHSLTIDYSSQQTMLGLQEKL